MGIEKSFSIYLSYHEYSLSGERNQSFERSEPAVLRFKNDMIYRIGSSVQIHVNNNNLDRIRLLKSHLTRAFLHQLRINSECEGIATIATTQANPIPIPIPIPSVRCGICFLALDFRF